MGVIFVLGDPVLCTVGMEIGEQYCPLKHHMLSPCALCSRFAVIGRDKICNIESNIIYPQLRVASVHTSCLDDRATLTEFGRHASTELVVPEDLLPSIFDGFYKTPVPEEKIIILDDNTTEDVTVV